MKKTFILLFMAFSQFMMSQNVTGVVTDDSGEPLIGASVMEKKGLRLVPLQI